MMSMLSALKNIFSGCPNDLRPMSRGDFNRLKKQDSYYNERRWKYLREVIRIVKRERPRSILELGPYKAPVVQGSDMMDRDVYFDNLTVQHDATQIPWPQEDKQYDMFIALQVWEHLEGKQQDAFKEVMRVSRQAILSFPYNWDCPGDCHHGITRDTIHEWTLGIEPEEIIDVHRRIVYYWRFD